MGEGGAWAIVLGIHPVFKSFSINMQEEDMEKLGIRKYRYFAMTVGTEQVSHGEKEMAVADKRMLKVFYGSYPFLVDKGTWIAFDHPDGYLCIDIFGWYDFTDTAAEAGVCEGTQVFVSSLIE